MMPPSVYERRHTIVSSTAVTPACVAAMGDMYAAAASAWIESGCFTHFVSVPASDAAAIDGWFSLGFGKGNVLSVRQPQPLPGESSPQDVEIRRAGPDDLELIVRFDDGMGRHLAGSPMFFPALPERHAERRTLHEGRLADESRAYFLAYRAFEPVGMMHFGPPPSGRPNIPDGAVAVEHAYVDEGSRGAGIGSALLANGLDWACDVGPKPSIVDYEPANLVASRFWVKNGYRPISYWLARSIDDRIEWARGF